MKKIVKILLLLAVLPQVFAAETGKSTVIVSTAAQRTYVYDEEGSLIRTFVCSTGLFDGDNDTPFGDYIINESGKKRGSWFFSKTYKETEFQHQFNECRNSIALMFNLPQCKDNAKK